MVHVGIDIGTSNTVVALVNGGGMPEVRTIGADGQLVPSAVAVTEGQALIDVGRDAVDAWSNPDHDRRGVFRRWKLQMGDDECFRTMRLGDAMSDPVDITPEWLTTQLVEHVLKSLSSGVGGEEVESVLVTVPHGWRRDKPQKCRATRQAAEAAKVEKAGADVSVKVQQKTVSEPVAAAAFCLWAAQREGGPDWEREFAGKHILVCDVGGGTCDLSLVRVSEGNAPLAVVDAINNDYAGDYVTALIMARATEQYNKEYDAALDTDPDSILSALSAAPPATLRARFLALQAFQQLVSDGIAGAAKRGDALTRPKRVALDCWDEPDRLIKFELNGEQFAETLEPFYAKGRKLVASFLGGRHSDERPYAVVFAGGGSRIAGVEQRMVAEALRELGIADVDRVIARLKINDARTDQAIALGAALIANDLVKVEERLLNDVGLVAEVGEELCKVLGIPSGGQVLLLPVLKKGAVLPATYDTEVDGFLTEVSAGQGHPFTIVIDDDPADPFVQPWNAALPPGNGSHECSVVVVAGQDGGLTVTLKFVDGSAAEWEGSLARTKSGRASLVFRALQQVPENRNGMPRVSLEQLRDAVATVRSGGVGR